MQLAPNNEMSLKGWAHLNLLTQAKKHLKSARAKAPFPHQHMDKFPDHPMQLPKELFAHAYTACDQPKLATQPNLDLAHMAAPQRQSHHTVKSDTGTSVTCPGASRNEVLGILAAMFGSHVMTTHDAPALPLLQTPQTSTTPALPTWATPEKQAPTPALPTWAMPENEAKHAPPQEPSPAAGISLALPRPPRLESLEADADADKTVEDDEAIMREVLAKKGR